ncbi:receptor-type tyrosine-protein phosphatase H-like [Antennarius striatus]|uniref:receptor-type tyrosine-protein phosphatase H-like n=1 Tax=Antennarius striatus TaxID=241820 RepID=UPI0035B33426
MKLFPFKINSVFLLLSAFLSVIWCAAVKVTNDTAPEDVNNVEVLTQNESSITLRWDKVNNISTYRLQYDHNGSLKVENINVSHLEASITYEVSSLNAGTEYNFTLITVFGDLLSSGHIFKAVTAPNKVNNVEVLTQNESSITLRWDKVNNISTYRLQYDHNGSLKVENINVSHLEASITYEVSPLNAGTEYNFTLITVFEDVVSSGYNFQAVTAPNKVNNVEVLTQNESSITLRWDKVNNISTYRLQYDHNGSLKVENINVSHLEASITYEVSPLNAGTEYNFTLITVFEDVFSSGYNFQAVTAPNKVNNVEVLTQNESSITLRWDKVNNISTYRLQYDHNGSLKVENINVSHLEASITYEVSPLNAGTEYNFTLITVFGDVLSRGYNFKAVTAPNKVQHVEVLTQNESSITLRWEKVNNISTYRLQYDHNGSLKVENINVSHLEASITYKVSSLNAGTEYNFTLITVFGDLLSSGYNFQAVTVPLNAEEFEKVTQSETSITLRWKKVDDIRDYVLVISKSEINITATAEHHVTRLISNLTSMTEYNFTLFTVFENIKSRGVHTTASTAPPNVKDIKTVTQNETSITLQWEKVNGILSYKLSFNGGEINVTASAENEKVTHTIPGLTSGTKYNFSVFALFKDIRSSGFHYTAVTAPRNPERCQSVEQNETSITLLWRKVDAILTYRLLFNKREINVSAFAGQENVTHTILDLKNGTNYNFSLFALFENIGSKGVTCTAATVPSMVTDVRIDERSATRITLNWTVDVDKNWSYFLQMGGESLLLHPIKYENFLVHSVTSLQPGKEHSFSVITTFSGLNSTAYKDFTPTTIDSTTVNWHVTNSSIQGMVEGLFTKATATNNSQSHTSPGGSNVSFTGLYPGATYKVSLVYERNSKSFLQYSHSLTIIPPDLKAHCENWAGGYSVYILWDEPDGVWTAVEVNVTGKTHTLTDGENHIQISGFQPARTYEVSLASLSGARKSEPFVFLCATDGRGVIAGSVIGVLLFVTLVCLTVFILHKRPDIIRKKTFFSGSSLYKKCEAVSAVKFPDHFSKLSEDDNRGFTQEYESLRPVGTEQTWKEAILPENKPRNRFSNVLPYDWSRVKLTTSNPDATSDYINASYIPGSNNKREYIATQGPLPNTVNDFWRMIWEQRVTGIVMVTNCIEKERTKSEKYWPKVRQPHHYGNLLVTTRSEQQEPNWTLRDFTVKNSSTSEVRSVKHFHFTAWPDHGVPQGTEVLIQFRELIRRHIQTNGNAVPTVVHCSAGVGRTGTIIALDVLLQQLEREKVVGIKAFVHKMRLSRPHMVQTESQYIFLHQCIMDSLQPNMKPEENIYMNADMMYVNSTALREFHRNT